VSHAAIHPDLSCSSLHTPAVTPRLHSFPTRRSSDLRLFPPLRRVEVQTDALCIRTIQRVHRERLADAPRPTAGVSRRPGCMAGRSEEHTSELQSRFDLVCRLLLEKKKNTIRVQLITR